MRATVVLSVLMLTACVVPEPDSSSQPSAEATYAPMELTAQQIDVPDSTGTVVNGVNDSGTVVGVYLDDAAAVHGFLMREGEAATPIEVPGATSTFAQAVNGRDEIVGDLVDPNGNSVGFRWADGDVEIIRCPSGESTYLTGISLDGLIVGTCRDKSGASRAFRYVDSMFTPIASDGELAKVVEATDAPRSTGTGASHVSDDGRWVVAGFGGFGGGGGSRKFIIIQPKDDEFALVNDPQSLPDVAAAIPVGVSNDGAVLGQYFGVDDTSEDGYDPELPVGFLSSDGKVMLISIPGVNRGAPLGISGDGTLVVGYVDTEDGRRHGFRASLPPG